MKMILRESVSMVFGKGKHVAVVIFPNGQIVVRTKGTCFDCQNSKKTICLWYQNLIMLTLCLCVLGMCCSWTQSAGTTHSPVYPQVNKYHH